MNNFKGKTLLVGSGYMAKEYLKVLRSLNSDVIIVGRGQEKIEQLKMEFPEFEFHSGGLHSFIHRSTLVPSLAINASSINQLSETTVLLLNAGVKNVLLEKPGGLTHKGLIELEDVAKSKHANIHIAYNRRFYSSIIQLKKEIELDGGLLGAHFEFTEWISTIDPDDYDTDSLDRWVLSNSSHVIDTAFNLIGLPRELHSIIQGQNQIDWHKSGSTFVGSGLSVNNVPFTYHSNWNAPGRWAIEVLTKNRRFYLRPLEKLAVQLKGSVIIEEFPIDDELDKKYKPGLFIQTKMFLENNTSDFCTIEEQKKSFENIYLKMAGYSL